MKITIIGPGAMGILFALKCSISGHKTTLVDYDGERAKRLSKSGLSMVCSEETITARPTVSTDIPGRQDLIIVLTKSHATRTLKLPTTVPVLSLQNGLGNIETLCKVAGSANIIAGTTAEASTLLEEGCIRHAAPGITTLGSWTSCPVDTTVTALQESGFDVKTTVSPGQMLWEKTVINAGINPLTALLNVPNGDLLKKKHTRQLMRDLVVEAARVASTEGYRFEYSLVEKAEEVCRDTASNISSMLQDIRANRKTEVEAISGEIIRRAEAASLTTPRTRVIYQLIKGLEAQP